MFRDSPKINFAFSSDRTNSTNFKFNEYLESSHNSSFTNQLPIKPVDPVIKNFLPFKDFKFISVIISSFIVLLLSLIPTQLFHRLIHYLWCYYIQNNRYISHSFHLPQTFQKLLGSNLGQHPCFHFSKPTMHLYLTSGMCIIVSMLGEKSLSKNI